MLREQREPPDPDTMFHSTSNSKIVRSHGPSVRDCWYSFFLRLTIPRYLLTDIVVSGDSNNNLAQLLHGIENELVLSQCDRACSLFLRDTILLKTEIDTY